jgi:hypothetical protein
MGFCGGATCDGLSGAIGVGVGKVTEGSGACEPEPMGLPGAGFGIFPALSEVAWVEAPSTAIDAVPAGGLLK